ncbi:hypothetical protein EBZ39_12805 [bacterium]|nr:hypothetical protein [bacterium]
MNIGNIGEILGLIKEMDTQRVKMACMLANVITADSPDSSESLALRMAAVASLEDFIDELGDEPHNKALRQFLQKNVDAAWERAGRMTDVEDLRETIGQIRRAAKEKVARMNDGDSILGGVDFSDN